MNIVQLVSAIGSDNIGIQALDTCVTDLRQLKACTKITLACDQSFDLNGLHKFGLLVWADRQVVADAVAALKEQNQPAKGYHVPDYPAKSWSMTVAVLGNVEAAAGKYYKLLEDDPVLAKAMADRAVLEDLIKVRMAQIAAVEDSEKANVHTKG